MAKADKGTKFGRSSASGQFMDVRTAKTSEGSALTHSTSKVGPRSSEVLKTVSAAHSEALKRLKDR